MPKTGSGDYPPGLYRIRAMIARLSILFVIVPGLLATDTSLAHGSVTPEDDLCIIRIGYYRAHFKLYLPRTRAHNEYCEDLPESGEAIFVMEYEHSGLGDVPIDFRIIRNVTGQGIFTSLEDVERIADLEAVTVFHHPAAIQPDVFTVMHNFESEGEFVGVVTASHPETGKRYTAVFPFEVGFTGLAWWPWFVAIAIILQVNYLWMSGWFGRFAGKRRQPAVATGQNHA